MPGLVNTHIIEPLVSPLVPQQFPAFYRDSYPLFIAFVQAYYEWLEQSPNPIYYTRNFLDLNDIDNTLQSFLVYFKEKYFVNIQLTTEADTRQLIKHALDIYRSKGTEREIKLLFQLLYDEQINFYYPKTDLFRLSDGVWEVPVYLELSLSQNNVLLDQKEVIGATSGAIAFIDSVIRRKSATSNLNDIAYISGIVGNFQTGEKIIPTDGSLNASLCPIVTGSLTSIIITDPGTTFNFNIGDLVNIISATGEGGIGRVDSVSNLTGLLTFNLVDGGYAYTTGANCYVSNTLLKINTTAIGNSYSQVYFKLFETIAEPMATINYTNIANGSFSVGDILSAYSNSTTFSGNGIILTVNAVSTSNGILLVSTANGSLSANLLFNQGNVVSANLASSNGYTNSTATGQIIGISNTTLGVISQVGGFIAGESVIQYWDNLGIGRNPSSYIGIGSVASISSNTVEVSNVRGIFRPNLTIYGLQSGATANATTITNSIGLYNVNGTFNNFSGNYYTSDSTNGSITLSSSGNNDAGFSVANNLQFTETVLWNSDQLQTYANVKLNATTYGFPANASINATANVIASALSYSNITVGKIGSVLAFNQGTGYNVPQFAFVYEPKSYVNQEFDNTLYVSGMAGAAFNTGEVISQAATGARGLVQFSNTSVVFIQNLRYNANDQFFITSNSTTLIVGANSGVTANVNSVEYNEWNPVEGINAKITTSTLVNIGAISSVVVVDSGFNFIDGQAVQVGNGTVSATGIAFLFNQGSGTGFYAQRGGFTSDSKKLFDGFYWQEFSYEIISSQTLDKYEKTLKQLAHVAGIALFGRVVHSSQNIIDASAANTVQITIFNPDLLGDTGNPQLLIVLDII